MTTSDKITLFVMLGLVATAALAFIGLVIKMNFDLKLIQARAEARAQGREEAIKEMAQLAISPLPLTREEYMARLDHSYDSLRASLDRLQESVDRFADSMERMTAEIVELLRQIVYELRLRNALFDAYFQHENERRQIAANSQFEFAQHIDIEFKRLPNE
jgi:CII-binding regulator of phage lambda lysogenization HflD